MDPAACLPIGFFAVMGVVVVGIVIWSNKRAEMARQNIARVLEPFAGRLIEASLFGGNGAEFEMDGVGGRLSWHAGSKNNPAYTQIEFNHRAPGLLRLRHEGFLGSIRKLFGGQDVQVGDEAFDGVFQIEATPESFARQALSREARTALLAWSPQVVFDVQRDRVLFRVGRYLPVDEMSLSAFVRDARTLLGAVRTQGERGSGVVITSMTNSGGDCPTCGVALQDPVATCAKCGTRQHADCWDYMGMCATYACGGCRRT